jgi:hypothetical protein
MNLRNVICLDLETCLIRASLQAPPVSVCSIYHPSTGTKLYGTFELEAAVEKWLRHPDCIIVGHNIAYDMLCLFEWYPSLRGLIIAAYEANRIVDTGLLQRIVEISTGDMRGQLALDRLCARYGIQMKNKHAVDDDGEEIKLGFGKHWGTDLSRLTALERAYCTDDVEDCWTLFERIWNKGWANQADLGKLCRTDFALKTISAFGLRADPAIVEKLELEAHEMIAKLTTLAIEGEFMRYDKGKPNPVRTKKAYQTAIAEAYGIPTILGTGRNRNVLYPDPTRCNIQELSVKGLVTRA